MLIFDYFIDSFHMVITLIHFTMNRMVIIHKVVIHKAIIHKAINRMATIIILVVITIDSIEDFIPNTKLTLRNFAYLLITVKYNSIQMLTILYSSKYLIINDKVIFTLSTNGTFVSFGFEIFTTIVTETHVTTW